MSKGARPQALLLDFYGTVVQEDDAVVVSVCRRIADSSPLGPTPAEVGERWSQVFREMCAEGFGSKFQSQRDLEWRSLKLVVDEYRCGLDPLALSRDLYEYWAHPILFPDARETLASTGIPICLVSNIDNADLQSALRSTALSFDLIVTSEDCRSYKPRGEMFVQALALLGLPRDRVLHVGDSLSSDVAGAKASGIPVLWVNRRNRPRRAGAPEPDYESADLCGLAAQLGSSQCPPENRG